MLHDPGTSSARLSCDHMSSTGNSSNSSSSREQPFLNRHQPSLSSRNQHFLSDWARGIVHRSMGHVLILSWELVAGAEGRGGTKQRTFLPSVSPSLSRRGGVYWVGRLSPRSGQEGEVVIGKLIHKGC